MMLCVAMKRASRMARALINLRSGGTSIWLLFSLTGSPDAMAEPSSCEAPANDAERLVCECQAATPSDEQETRCQELDMASEAVDAKTPTPGELDEVPELNTMKTPSSPAFTLLGQSPTDVERPTTPSGLAAALSSRVARDGTNVFFESLALEVSPFWLWPHPELVKRSDLDDAFLDRVVENFTVSVATEVSEAPDDPTSTAMGDSPPSRAAIGGRTMLAKGKPSKTARQCHLLLYKLNKRASERIVKDAEYFNAVYKKRHPRPPKPKANAFSSSEEFKRALEAWKHRIRQWDKREGKAFDEYEAERATAVEPGKDEAFQRCLTAVHHRVGFLMSIAGGAQWDFAENDLAEGELTQYGVWITPAYDFDPITLAGAVRFLHVEGDTPQDVYDFGARLIYARGAFGLSAEGVARIVDVDGSDVESRWRVAFGVDYEMSPGVWLNTTLGKDYGTGDSQPLLALANLEFNLGAKASVKPDTGWVVATPKASSGEASDPSEQTPVAPPQPESSVAHPAPDGKDERPPDPDVDRAASPEPSESMEPPSPQPEVIDRPAPDAPPAPGAPPP